VLSINRTLCSLFSPVERSVRVEKQLVRLAHGRRPKGEPILAWYLRWLLWAWFVGVLRG
jgi:hypothetical protein